MVWLGTKNSIGAAPNDGTGTVWRTAWSNLNDAIDGLVAHEADVANPHTVTEAQLGVSHSKSLHIVSPASGTTDMAFFQTTRAITITEIVAVCEDGTTPSVLWHVYHDGDRSAAGTSVITAGTTTTNETTGESVTTFNDATIDADRHVWLETPTVSGTIAWFEITIHYTHD